MEDTPEIDEEEIIPKELVEEKPPEPPPSPEPDAETEAWISGEQTAPLPATPERQEIRTSPETIVEKEPGNVRPMRDAPAQMSDRSTGQIDLAPEVSDEMDQLWKQSVKEDGTVQEHAATLTTDQEGNAKLVNAVAGDSDRVTPNRDVPEGEQLIGTFHTHPYEDGTTGAAFSGEDIAYAINSGDGQTLVQSGEDTFALVRTDATPASVDGGQLAAEFKRRLFEYQDAGLPFTQALFDTNRDLCQQYGLAFYAGKHGTLKEVV